MAVGESLSAFSSPGTEEVKSRGGKGSTSHLELQPLRVCPTVSGGSGSSSSVGLTKQGSHGLELDIDLNAP